MNIKRKISTKKRYLAYSLLISLSWSHTTPHYNNNRTTTEHTQKKEQKNVHSCMAAPPNTERCYGISQKGRNHCASPINKHSCHSMASKDYDPNEWEYVPKGKCSELKKKLSPKIS
jgi:uncharacterized membrane protein